MAKRPRGKTAKKLEEKKNNLSKKDEGLQSATWQSLNNEVNEEDQDTGDFLQEDSDEEQDYELRPRKFQIQEDDLEERLPVKTAEGTLERRVNKKKLKDTKNDDEQEETEEQGKDVMEDELSGSEDEGETRLSDAERMKNAKELIAEAAEALYEDPEENINQLRKLRDLIQRSKLFKVKQLVILALVPIYKNIIPGYRIKPLTEAQKKEKVSKDVRKLRNFEESILAYYKSYIDQLKDFVKKGRKTDEGSVRFLLANSSITAACELLVNVPHFNFQQDLIDIIVQKLSVRKYDKAFEKCISTVEQVFESDEEGQVSFEIVRLMSKMIKARNYKVDPALIGSLLHLRLLTELSAKADLERVQTESKEPKLKKKDRVHLSKKERKARKERKAIDEEMRKAENAVSAEERERLQGQTLKLVFILYFNILKERSSTLMPATLEGLAKFAHLINADLFGDLLEVLRELIEERQKREVDGEMEFRESATREALLCVVTAFALLSGQAGESMNLDLSFFITHFYSSLYALSLNPDIEFSHKTLRLEDPLKHSDNTTGNNSLNLQKKVDIATETEMVVRAFEAIFFKQKRSNIGRYRIQAFAKRLSIAMLHFPEKSTIASLKILDKMIKKFHTTVPSLFSTDDRVANGVFHMDVDKPEHSNPEAATIWETVVLENHYDPKIAKAARSVIQTARTELNKR